jgi:hypothetical protein
MMVVSPYFRKNDELLFEPLTMVVGRDWLILRKGGASTARLGSSFGTGRP